MRAALAEKIGRAMARLSADPRVAMQVAVLDALETLARDQVPRVRITLAEALKDSADAPVHVMGWLARDWDIEVSGPVLSASPLLTEQDLVAVIANAARAGALLAIAHRDELSAEIADAIVATGDRPATVALLANPSASLRDATIDRLIENSRAVVDMQAPLTGRPGLASRGAVKLASFVAGRALETLRVRSDFDARTLAAIERVVSARLAGGARDEPFTSDNPGTARARRLHEARHLDEESIVAALDDGEQAFVAEALSLLAKVPAGVVGHIRAARSGKGMTALAWKAGLSMRCAVRLQARFAGIAAAEIINARDGFDFPMTRDEMEWMLDFFRN
ncbi:MAG TPA: DUF2336 domain-containing protein [Alphaproteobacteria bacterium]|nr:DUF2336 domain-containing protein [Alphaproteobacteria bacterium]